MTLRPGVIALFYLVRLLEEKLAREGIGNATEIKRRGERSRGRPAAETAANPVGGLSP